MPFSPLLLLLESCQPGKDNPIHRLVRRKNQLKQRMKAVFKGIEGVRGFYQAIAAALPDLRIEVQSEYDVPGCSIREVVISGTHKGEFAGVKRLRQLATSSDTNSLTRRSGAHTFDTQLHTLTRHPGDSVDSEG